MQIDPDVYLIGSGRLGFDMTDRYDCNIYLFDAGGSYIVFDAGAGLDLEPILAVCRQDGLDPARIGHLFLTHAHADHGGGAASWRDRVHPEIYASKATATIISTGDEAAVSLPPARAAGMYPKDYVYHACPVDHILPENAVVEVGPYKIELIATPGHSHDHHCYLVTTPRKRYLVGGDAIFFGGKIILQHTYDCSVPDTIASIQRLAGYSFDALLAGHLNFSLNRGKRHVEAACEVIGRLGCPASIG